MLTRTALLVIAIAAGFMFVLACEPEETQYGCKIMSSCTCGYGCKTEFIFRSRRECLDALRERSANPCSRIPCMRGICTQTVQQPGYACKCEGTGFFGQRCEKACPTVAVRGLVFPHECVVI
ncbi:cubilin-like [Vanessa tameamea]|uniref:Cubilin-like n=1 Tax=Vanessa tameamea TaxID=334116 RepID=A0A8B8IVS9_VANTA|nr:cubilin-like [Vanessa tameamea]XP_047543908.1 cubilin-like [Vanessa atalanta]